ncbi:hypothetical protein P8452_39652 [Trifolium repens]|nr:hypothetical protein P8452_39652 [Trifolium repens]
MARPFEMIKDINDSKSVWKLAVLVRDLWTVSNSNKRQHIEMVIVDKQGNDIQVIVPFDLVEHFKEKLAENTSFTLYNFEVEKNNVTLKCSPHPFKLVFNSCTVIDHINGHEIPNSGYKFADFAELKAGKYRPDVVVDIIGVFEELGYTQTVPGNRKVQVNFTLKDNRGETLKCTLWEDFALQFQNYNSQRTDWGHTIIVIHNGKIKEATEKYELGVSNAWNATKLFINDDIPPINEFKASLPHDQPGSSQSLSLTCRSQILTQSSTTSFVSAPEKFLQKATALPIQDIVNLTEVTVCATVGKCIKLIPNPKGWYYKACGKCNKVAKGDTLPLVCPDGHETHAINLRYKLEYEVEFNKATAKFIFWDRECNELLGKTAADLHAIMVEAGVTNPLEQPLCLDNICGRAFAFRAKWQPLWETLSVQAVKEDAAFINKITDLFPINEETSKVVPALTSQSAEIEPLDSMDDVPSLDAIPSQPIELINSIASFDVGLNSVENNTPTSKCSTQATSASSTYDPDAVDASTPSKVSSITPSKDKRTATAALNVEGADYPTQLSSTRPKRNIIKLEKK